MRSLLSLLLLLPAVSLGASVSATGDPATVSASDLPLTMTMNAGCSLSLTLAPDDAGSTGTAWSDGGSTDGILFGYVDLAATTATPTALPGGGYLGFTPSGGYGLWFPIDVSAASNGCTVERIEIRQLQGPSQTGVDHYWSHDDWSSVEPTPISSTPGSLWDAGGATSVSLDGVNVGYLWTDLATEGNHQSLFTFTAFAY